MPHSLSGSHTLSYTLVRTVSFLRRSMAPCVFKAGLVARIATFSIFGPPIFQDQNPSSEF